VTNARDAVKTDFNMWTIKVNMHVKELKIKKKTTYKERTPM